MFLQQLPNFLHNFYGRRTNTFALHGWLQCFINNLQLFPLVKFRMFSDIFVINVSCRGRWLNMLTASCSHKKANMKTFAGSIGGLVWWRDGRKYILRWKTSRFFSERPLYALLFFKNNKLLKMKLHNHQHSYKTIFTIYCNYRTNQQVTLFAIIVNSSTTNCSY